MKPRQCKCGCFVADQLKKCPKCGTKMKPIIAAEAKEEKKEQETERMAVLDNNAKVLNGSKLKWVIPLSAQKHHRAKWKDLLRRVKSGMKYLRAEMREYKRTALLPRAGRWTWEYLYRHDIDKDGHAKISKGVVPRVYISPKGNKYVEARSNEKPDLILAYDRKIAGAPFRVRLRRLEKSSIMRQTKKEIQEQREHSKAMRERKKAKKKRRVEKRKIKKRLVA